MAGGVSYRCATLTIGGTSVLDLQSYGAMLSADMLYNRADCRKYPQQAATTNHRATLSCRTLNIGKATQSASSTPLIGSDAGTVVLTVSNTSSGTMVYTINPAVYTRAEVAGNLPDELAGLDLEFEAAGTDGTEPTVTWASGV